VSKGDQEIVESLRKFPQCGESGQPEEGRKKENHEISGRISMINLIITNEKKRRRAWPDDGMMKGSNRIFWNQSRENEEVYSSCNSPRLGVPPSGDLATHMEENISMTFSFWICTVMCKVTLLPPKSPYGSLSRKL
jgi:hypothetical protein